MVRSIPRTAIVALAFVSAAAIPSPLVANPSPQADPVTLLAQLSGKPGSPEGVDTLLRVAASVPDGVYRQGPAAVQQYLKQKYQISRAYSTLGACAGGIVAAIGANAVVAAKVFKVKKAVEALGGIARAVDQIRGKIKRGKKFNDAVYEVFNEGGAGLGAIALEIFSLDLVANNCF